MKTQDTLLSLLGTLPCFADLDPGARATLAAKSSEKVLQSDELVFLEGESCQHLYVLGSGRIKCSRTNAGGREQVLRVFDQPGDMLCICSAFKHGKYIVSATSMADSRLFLLKVETVRLLTKEHPSFAIHLVTHAAEQMESLVELAEDLSLKTATARLAKYLHERAMIEGIPKKEGFDLLRDRFPEEELAIRIGAVRVHVSRSLKRLVNLGALRLTRDVIHIVDPSALGQLSRDEI